MELQEKKYLVDSFNTIKKLLDQKRAPKVRSVISTHYYGQHSGNDVEKFVEYPNRCETHILKESNGRFTMTEHASITDRNAGIAWLKKRGFTMANVVKMDYTEYSYKDGTIGLYFIDDLLYSVVLNYPEGEHDAIEKEFKLQGANVITVPYNKLLEQMDRLRLMKLN